MKAIAEQIQEHASELFARAVESEQLGKVSDVSVKILRESGLSRMLQPRDFGGSESHPSEFFDAVIDVAALDPAAGWVAGVVGLHPWDVAQFPRIAQEAVWGIDQDTWIGSPYAPLGRAEKVKGGYKLNGHWSFSSGVDHCAWVIIGGFQVGIENPPWLIFLVPRSDYEVIEGSWDVIGLQGSGSKDLVVKDAFVPDDFVVKFEDFYEGRQASRVGRAESTLYRMPKSVVFPGVITAATLGMAKGAVAAFEAFARGKSEATGKFMMSPFQLAALGTASADVDASIVQLLADVDRIFDDVEAGKPISVLERARFRRNNVRSVQRCVNAIDHLFMQAGGTSIRRNAVLQRYWRDLHAATNHVSNQVEPFLEGYSLALFGEAVMPALRLGPEPSSSQHLGGDVGVAVHRARVRA